VKLKYGWHLRRGRGWLDGGWIRPHRNGSEKRARGLPGPPQGQGGRRAVPTLWGLRPHREGRSPRLQHDRGDRCLQDPRHWGSEDDEDPRPDGLL